MRQPKKLDEGLYETMYKELVKTLADKDMQIINLQQEKAQMQQRLDDLKELEQYLGQQRAYQRLVTITPVETKTWLR